MSLNVAVFCFDVKTQQSSEAAERSSELLSEQREKVLGLLEMYLSAQGKSLASCQAAANPVSRRDTARANRRLRDATSVAPSRRNRRRHDRADTSVSIQF